MLRYVKSGKIGQTLTRSVGPRLSGTSNSVGKCFSSLSIRSSFSNCLRLLTRHKLPKLVKRDSAHSSESVPRTEQDYKTVNCILILNDEWTDSRLKLWYYSAIARVIDEILYFVWQRIALKLNLLYTTKYKISSGLYEFTLLFYRI